MDSSTYDACLAIPIDKIPNITKFQKDQIKKYRSDLKTIRDLLIYQDPGSELRQAYGIGKVRARGILESVTRFVDEFLS